MGWGEAFNQASRFSFKVDALIIIYYNTVHL